MGGSFALVSIYVICYEDTKIQQLVDVDVIKNIYYLYYSFCQLLTQNSRNNSPFSHKYKHNLKTTHQLVQASNFQVKN